MFDYFILSKCSLIEIGDGSKIMSPEKATVIGSLESVEVYANVLQEAKHNLTPLVRVDQCLGTAVTNPRIAWSTTIILPYQRQLKFPFSWWEIGVE